MKSHVICYNSSCMAFFTLEEDQTIYSWENLYPQSLPKYAPAGFRITEEVELYNETAPRDELYSPYLTEYCIPKTWPNLDTASEQSEYQTAIRDYIDQMTAQWICGQSDIEADWDSYVEQLNALGLERLVELREAVIAE